MKIVTTVVNTSFIELQLNSFKKFFKHDFDFIVFNDSKNFPDSTNNFELDMKNKVQNLCNSLNILCINHQNDYHFDIKSGSFRHASVLNKILKYQIENPDKYLYIDNDMFLIDYFDPTKYFNHNCAIVLQERIVNNFKYNYIWPGLCFIDFHKISNIHLLNWNLAKYCDTGGMMMNWLILENYNNVFPKCQDIRHNNDINKFHTKNIYFIKHLWSKTWSYDELPTNFKSNINFINLLNNDSRNDNDKYYIELYDNVFLHYRGGSGWNNNLDLNFINNFKKSFDL
jgi:hypothetical protein